MSKLGTPPPWSPTGWFMGATRWKAAAVRLVALTVTRS